MPDGLRFVGQEGPNVYEHRWKYCKKIEDGSVRRSNIRDHMIKIKNR